MPAFAGMTARGRRSPALSPHQLIGEIADGLAIDHSPVPLAHRVEIRRALVIGRAHLKAVAVEQIGGRGQHVGGGVTQIDAAVAIEIDAVFDVGGRQELGLADLARISADQVAQRQVAALRLLTPPASS